MDIFPPSILSALVFPISQLAGPKCVCVKEHVRNNNRAEVSLLAGASEALLCLMLPNLLIPDKQHPKVNKVSGYIDKKDSFVN